MKISEVHIKGFRNFKDARLNFNNHTAIMGFNDIGKTNLIYAIRLLLDKNISEAEMELTEADFFVYEETNNIEIVIKFDEVTEDFVLAKLREFVSDNGVIYLKYTTSKNDNGFKLFIGSSLDLLEEIQGRYYLKAFNLKYVGSSRNLSSFIQKEKKILIEKAKETRNTTDIASDTTIEERVESSLASLNTDVRNISYVKNATNKINNELNKLSFKNESQKLVLDMAGDDINALLGKVNLAASTNEKLLAIGGDGKLNQIFLALWTNKYNIDLGELNEVSFYCIEEPEAHLHPHQQRKLSEYLAETLNNQVIITTHSPQIISEFKPNSIIKLYQENGATFGANDGCSSEIEDELFNFAHRLDIISTEAFYANLVFLVEGQSEILFYKALAKAIDVDLDKLNISILMVDGVGFKPYIKVLELLRIPWIMRTDNDIFKVPKQDTYRFAGIQRSMDIYKTFILNGEELNTTYQAHLANVHGITLPADEGVINSTIELKTLLEQSNLFLSQEDLEKDLVNSPLLTKLKEFYDLTTKDEILVEMQNRKGGSMFEFLQKHQSDLSILLTDPISLPLLKCKKIIEAINDTD
ncbi:ATP-dependent nuclease [Aliarcobacter butzleri]|uniref:ATP-dependent nuclease n=1 Tax=Aliarcobacter butzleri TaxID=28197 RepID=UPI003AF6F4EB